MQDLRLAVRSLLATPLVTVVAVLSLALGIGANTSIFSLIDVLLVRPLPVAAPERLAVMSDTRGTERGFTEQWMYPVWEEFRAHAQPFDSMCAWWGERLNLAPQGGEEQSVDALWVSGDYFATLGVPTLLGRTIGAADDAGGAQPVAVISYDFWQRHFAGAANAIGSSLTVEHLPFAVVGVAPPGFFGAEVGRTFDIAVPLHAEAQVRGTDSRFFNRDRPFSALTVLGRLKPGQSPATATAMLRGIQPQVRAAAMPPSYPPMFKSEFLKDPFVVLPAGTGISRLRRYEQPLLIIFGIVVLVLLIACANIANLQLARGIARRQELAVRIALGASRWQLVRAWVVESLLVSASGALAGLIFARSSSYLIVSRLSTALNHVYVDLRLDWRVWAFTLIATGVTTTLFGVLPAIHATRVAPGDALKEQGRASVRADSVRLSNGLVVAQVAVSVVIVFAAGLFVRTFQKLANVPLGFDSGRVLLMNVKVPRSQKTPADKIAFVTRLARDVSGLPGVASAGASAVAPGGGIGLVTIVHVPGSSTSGDLGIARLGPRNAYVNFVTPGWFATYGTPITAGRDFTDSETRDSPGVIIVNEAFVNKFLADRNPIGATVVFEQGRTTLVEKTVIGVVPNLVYNSQRNADEAAQYAPMSQMDLGLPPFSDGVVSVRAASGSPMLLVRSIAARLATADVDLVFGFRLLTDQVDASVTQERLVAMLSGFLGVLAVVLAGLGLYGITGYGVARRRVEIAIRMALGSTSADVSRAVLVRAVSLVGMGIAVGVVASFWASKFVGTLLFGLDARDPQTLLGTVGILVAVAVVASWVPASRAAHIDPADVLRNN